MGMNFGNIFQKYPSIGAVSISRCNIFNGDRFLGISYLYVFSECVLEELD